MSHPRFAMSAAVLTLLAFVASPVAQQAAPPSQVTVIDERELREHLSYIASDALEGRATYSEGLGLAAGYIAQHLKQWGVQPGGDNGTYFQRVPSNPAPAAPGPPPRTRFTRNVIGIVPGSDPALRDTYVVFGAHYDHVGLLDGAPRAGARPDDRIFNGADDDGSGTVALMALAKAFATGERPRRSLMFVWHTGEEGGLRGSRFNAERVDAAKIAAVLNIDMIGRNANDDPANANQLFVIGADRISTDLHNITEEANASLSNPLTLDYALNDPADPESLYTRSDHYSYALKGIPVAFFFTGLHADYHQVTDEVEKIDFAKLARVTRLIHETGKRIGNDSRAPIRDNKGPRAGKGFRGRIGR